MRVDFFTNQYCLMEFDIKVDLVYSYPVTFNDCINPSAIAK